MHQLLQITAVVVVLLIVLRVSLRRRGRSFDLRGRITALNLATGGLAGLAVGMILRDLTAGVAIDPADPGADVGYGVLGSALRSILPFTGAVFGALGGYLLLGTLWRRVAGRADAPRARAWLARLQIVVCAGCLLLIALGIARGR